MVKKLFYAFIFFAPFTSFFALSAWLRWPVIINQALFLFLLFHIFIRNSFNRKWLLKEDLLLLGFLALVWISFLVGFRERRSFNHSLAYTNAILFYFLLSKYIIKTLKISSIDISKIIYRSFVVCSLIILLDFVGKNYFNISLREFFSTPDGATSNMNYYIRAGMHRVGGVAEEPGLMSMFYNIYFGISLFYIHATKNKKKYYTVILLFLLSHFAMFSNAGLILPVVAVIIIFTYNKIRLLAISKKQVFWSAVSIFTMLLLFTLIQLADIRNNYPVVDQFIDKVIFSEEQAGSSSRARLDQWPRALSNFLDHPIWGSGPGYGVHQDKEGYLSVYLTVLSDIGIVAFILFVLFQISILIKTVKIKIPNRNFLLFSSITCFVHLLIISDFYHAPMWILFVFIQLVFTENKQGQAV